MLRRHMWWKNPSWTFASSRGLADANIPRGGVATDKSINTGIVSPNRAKAKKWYYHRQFSVKQDKILLSDLLNDIIQSVAIETAFDSLRRIVGLSEPLALSWEMKNSTVIFIYLQTNALKFFTQLSKHFRQLSVHFCWDDNIISGKLFTKNNWMHYNAMVVMSAE